MPKHALKKTYDRLLSQAVHPLLRAKGFQRKGYTWTRLSKDGLFHVLYIFNWKYNSPQHISFRFDLGFYLQDWERIRSGRENPKPSELSSILRSTTGDILLTGDPWFHLLDYTDVTRLEGVLKDLVGKHLLPEFDRLPDLESLTTELKRKYGTLGFSRCEVQTALPFLLSRQKKFAEAERYLSYALAKAGKHRDNIMEQAESLGILPGPAPGKLLSFLKSLPLRFQNNLTRRARIDRGSNIPPDLASSLLRIFQTHLVGAIENQILPLGFVQDEFGELLTYRRNVDGIQQILQITPLERPYSRSMSSIIVPGFFEPKFFKTYWPRKALPAQPRMDDCFLALYGLQSSHYITPETDPNLLFQTVTDFFKTSILGLFTDLTDSKQLGLFAAKRDHRRMDNPDGLGLPLYLALAGLPKEAKIAYHSTAKLCNPAQRLELREYSNRADLSVD